MTYLVLLGSAPSARADADLENLIDLGRTKNTNTPHSIADFAPLWGYAQRIGAEHSELAELELAHFDDANLVALRNYAQQIGAGQPKLASFVEGNSLRRNFDDAELAALHDYAQQIGAERPNSASITVGNSPRRDLNDAELAALRDYAQQIGRDQAASASTPRLKVAEADDALGALRELFGRSAPPDSPPNAPPNATPNSIPKSAPRAPSKPAKPAAPRYELPVISANLIGTGTCLQCHASQAASFANTVMGKISKTQPGRLECENCHGPGSEHLKAVGCAACHGESGITSKPGTPNLAAQDPQYLVTAMRAYVNGQRHVELKRMILSGIGEAEFHNLAAYYARQFPGRAATPLVGNPGAGRSATGVCAQCHGEQGVSSVPGWPSLAGQDSTYLAEAISAYKRGTRSKVIACAACHGESGVSRQPGMPSLVGQDPEYLVASMRTYVNGERKHGLMNALLSGVSDSELNNWAHYYAGQPPARAQTPLVGDPSAGKSASTTCVDCHGEGAGALSPEWPNLAGQDSQYLADAIRAYKHGSRDKVVACAACHGERGVSKLAGMPSLVGQNPEYLVFSMRTYVNGKRKHALMSTLLSGVSEGELQNWANYYAGQSPTRAQTSLVGDPSAGKAASTMCIGCHGEGAGALNPEWPSLAGQDAQYLADAIGAYKHGSRNKTVACAACHGERGISKLAGMPSLVGLDPQYLVASMKAYANGQRKHNIMNALLAGVGEAELNSIANYYARQAPARAQTPSVGDPAAGKTASATCAACHGEQGVSTNPAWPSLAGQDARYLASALKAYKDGSRSDATMKPFVASLDDKTINDIASYYAGLRPAQPSTKISGPVKSEDPVLVSNGLVAGLDERTINNIASYFASLHPAQPAAKSASGGGEEPVLISNGVVASLDDRAINDVASYFASLRPTYQSASGGGGRAPVVNGNRVMASLDERSIGTVASYYATLRPEQPASARHAPAGPVPLRVGGARPLDGRSLGGIMSFRLNDPTYTADQYNGACLGCHEKGNRTLWRGSAHDTRGLICTNCHTVMRDVTPKYQLAQLTEMDTCFQCHKNKRAQIWRSSHMPVREGKMTCSSCHNPHGSYGEALLKTATVNDACYKCHREKRGPFLWEHPPVRENCLNCHDPHGSMHDAMLKVSRPRLCQQCHTAADHPGNPGNPTAVYSIGAACSNCHVKIHGSNSPAGSQLVR